MFFRVKKCKLHQSSFYFSEKDNQEFYLLRRKSSLPGYDNRGTVDYDTNTQNR